LAVKVVPLGLKNKKIKRLLECTKNNSKREKRREEKRREEKRREEKRREEKRREEKRREEKRKEEKYVISTNSPSFSITTSTTKAS
jgi:hypothetical protein